MGEGCDVPSIAGFDDVSEIGRGGFATVYAATQAELGRRVAVKVLDVGPSGSRRMQREARALGGLSDIPHVVQVFHVTVTSDGRPALVMALMASSLASAMSDHKITDMGSVLQWLDQVSAALDEAHRRGVFHRDIKPANVLLSSAGDAFLADFGIAGLEDVQSNTTTAMSFSPPYSPPERLTGTDNDPRAGDVYSLAATFYALVTGSAPFGTADDGGVHGLISRVVSEPLPRPEQLPERLHQVFATAMAKDPAARPGTASEFAAAVRAAVGHDTPSDRTVRSAARVTAPFVADSGTSVLAAEPVQVPHASTPAPVPDTTTSLRQPAGFGRQLLALLVDGLFLGAIIVAIHMMILRMPPENYPANPPTLDGLRGPAVTLFGWPALRLWAGLEPLSFGIVLLWCSWELVLTAFAGTTLGHRLVGIRFVDSSGARPAFRRVLVRAVVRPPSALLSGAGYWLPAFRGSSQAWHDRLAGIIAVRDGRQRNE